MGARELATKGAVEGGPQRGVVAAARGRRVPRRPPAEHTDDVVTSRRPPNTPNSRTRREMSDHVQVGNKEQWR